MKNFFLVTYFFINKINKMKKCFKCDNYKKDDEINYNFRVDCQWCCECDKKFYENDLPKEINSVKKLKSKLLLICIETGYKNKAHYYFENAYPYPNEYLGIKLDGFFSALSDIEAIFKHLSHFDNILCSTDNSFSYSKGQIFENFLKDLYFFSRKTINTFDWKMGMEKTIEDYFRAKVKQSGRPNTIWIVKYEANRQSIDYIRNTLNMTIQIR